MRDVATLRSRLGEDRRPVVVSARKTAATVAAIAALAELGHPTFVHAEDLSANLVDRLVGLSDAGWLLDPETGRLDELPTRSSEALIDAGTLIMATSGSTGIPKLVPLPSAGIGRFLRWADETFEMHRAERVWSYAPLSFDLALFDVWAALAAGSHVVGVTAAEATAPGVLLGLLEEFPPDILQSVPLLHRLTLDRLRAPLSTTREVILTGEAFPLELLGRIERAYPRAQIVNIYGATETNDSFMSVVSNPEDRQGSHGSAGHDAGAVPIGRPMANCDAVLIDAHGALVEGVGQGQLATSTPFQVEKYVPDPADSPFGPLGATTGSRVYFRTGDHASRDAEGVYTIHGRNAEFVKVRGVRVGIRDIESALLAHEGIREAVVVPVDDLLEGTRLYAFIVADPGMSRLSVRMELASRLPPNAIPAKLTYQEDPLPRTPNGKPDRRHLVAALQQDRGD